MNLHELKSRLEGVFGNRIDLVMDKGDPKTVRLAVKQPDFLALLEKWKKQTPASLPNLIGFAPSPRSGSSLLVNLIFALDAHFPYVALEVEWAKEKKFPRASELWPYASWWEEEMEEFSGLQFLGEGQGGGAQWQRN